MATPRFAWGIDVGNRALKAIKLVRDGERLRVDDFDIIEHEQVLSNAGDNRDSLVHKALADFAQRHDIKGGIASIGVSGQSSFARFIKLPPVEPRKIPEIVRFEAIQQIPFPLDDVEWSYQLFQTTESPDIEVGIFAMRKELVNQHVKSFTDVDINVQVVQMNPLAVYNAMAYDGRLSETTMVIDLGAENCDLIIADNETVWLRSIPIGGNNFTESLVKSFKLNFAKAEDLKRNAATSKYARQIFQAMRPVFADLVAEIQRSIGFYASVHRDSRIRKIIALGGTFKLPGLLKYLQQNLQLEVERIDRFSAGSPSDGKQATNFNENLLSMVSAYGLAVQAIGDAKITSSLLPQHIRRAKLWQDKTKWFAGAAAMFVLGTGLAYGSFYMQQWAVNRSNETIKPQVDASLSEAKNFDSRWSEVESAGGGERKRIADFQGMLKYHGLWNNILDDIYKVVPKPLPAHAKLERKQREQVLLDTIDCKYLSSVAGVKDLPDPQFLAKAGGASSSGRRPWEDSGGTPSSDPNAPPGFLITITGTTPRNEGYSGCTQFIEQRVIRSLRGVKHGDQYHVARAALVWARPLSEERKNTMRTRYTAALEAIRTGKGPQANVPARPVPVTPTWRGRGPAPVTGGADDLEIFKDRQMPGETVLQDSEFRVLVLIQMGPAPAAPTPGSGT